MILFLFSPSVLHMVLTTKTSIKIVLVKMVFYITSLKVRFYWSFKFDWISNDGLCFKNAFTDLDYKRLALWPRLKFHVWGKLYGLLSNHNQISLADIDTVEEKSFLLKNALSLTLTRKSLRLRPRLKFHYWEELKSVLRFLINHLFNLFQIEKCYWFESLKPVFSKFQTQTSDTIFF